VRLNTAAWGPQQVSIIYERDQECCESDVFGHRRKTGPGRTKFGVNYTHFKLRKASQSLSIKLYTIASTSVQNKNIEIMSQSTLKCLLSPSLNTRTPHIACILTPPRQRTSQTCLANLHEVANFPKRNYKRRRKPKRKREHIFPKRKYKRRRKPKRKREHKFVYLRKLEHKFVYMRKLEHKFVFMRKREHKLVYMRKREHSNVFTRKLEHKQTNSLYQIRGNCWRNEISLKTKRHYWNVGIFDFELGGNCWSVRISTRSGRNCWNDDIFGQYAQDGAQLLRSPPNEVKGPPDTPLSLRDVEYWAVWKKRLK